MAKATVLLTLLAASVAPAACGLLSLTPGHSLARSAMHSVSRRSLFWPGREFGADPWGVVLGPPPAQANLDTSTSSDSSSNVSTPADDGDQTSSSTVDSVASPVANPAADPVQSNDPVATESSAPVVSTEQPTEPPVETPVETSAATPPSLQSSSPSDSADRETPSSTKTASAHTFIPKPVSTPTEPAPAPPKEVAPSTHSTVAEPKPSPKPSSQPIVEPKPTPSSTPSHVVEPQPAPTTKAAPPPVSSSAPSGSSTSSSDIEAYLSGHNNERAQHGASPLTWSDSLAATAQEWANNCVFQHSQGKLGPFGENLAAGTGSFSIAQGIGAWNAEASSYDPSNPQASHWTQVVWKASQQVGCAVQTCNGIFPSGAAQFYVCEYSPAGNVIGEFAQNVQA